MPFIVQPAEAKSKVLSLEYLQAIETIYKKDYLPWINRFTELKSFDWSSEGNIDLIIEVLENEKFETNWYGEKFFDWNMDKEYEWNEMRYFYTQNKEEVLEHFDQPKYEIDCMNLTTEEMDFRHLVYHNFVII